MQIFQPRTIRNLHFKNRIVMPPMCLFTAGPDGLAHDRHLVHYASRAMGGPALIIIEATGVLPEGRISGNCLGLWEEPQVTGLARIVGACQREGALMAIQLNHAGRKCEAPANFILGPSALAFGEDYPLPREMSKEDMDRVKEAFCSAALRADRAGFDAIEIHGAHGYLLSSFLSPLANQRKDEYGGSLEKRARFPLEVLEAVRQVWPKEKAILLRLSAVDHHPDGIQLPETVEFVRMARPLIDIVHISSGGNARVPIHVYPGYQLPLAQAVKKETGVPVIAVGLIQTREMAEDILVNGQADFVALGRELLRNPSWVHQNRKEAGLPYEGPDIYRQAFD